MIPATESFRVALQSMPLSEEQRTALCHIATDIQVAAFASGQRHAVGHAGPDALKPAAPWEST